MNDKLLADLVLRRVEELCPERLAQEGIRLILVDLDNTLTGQDSRTLDEPVRLWLEALRGQGIVVHILSNNDHERVSAFCTPRGLPFTAKARKPDTSGYVSAMLAEGCTAAQTMAVGDKVFTDVRGGKSAGLRTVLVHPRKPGPVSFVRYLIEWPFVRAAQKRQRRTGP